MNRWLTVCARLLPIISEAMVSLAALGSGALALCWVVSPLAKGGDRAHLALQFLGATEAQALAAIQASLVRDSVFAAGYGVGAKLC